MAGKNKRRKGGMKSKSVALKTISINLPASPLNVKLQMGKATITIEKVLFDAGWNTPPQAKWVAVKRYRVQGPAAALARIHSWFRLVEALVPKRLANEEIGDALEQVQRFAEEGRSHWYIYLKFASSAFWILAHAIGDVGARLQGRAK
jgi:hypothetical protein